MSKRIRTKHPGVYYRESQRIGGNGYEKIYYIVFKKDGKMVEEKVGRQYIDDMTEAKASRIRAERIEGKRLSRKEIKERVEVEKREKENRWTLDRLWQDFEKNKMHLKSLRMDRSRYTIYLKPNLGNKEPHELSPFDVDKIRVQLMKTHKPATVKHVLVVLKKLINYGVAKGLCDNLHFRIEMPKVNNLKTEDLFPAQLKRLLEVLNEDVDIQASHIMKLALFTGMRRSELFRLQWNDIDLQKGFIKIRSPKSGKDEIIPLNNAARTVLQSHPKTDSEYVFPGRFGGQRDNITKAANRIKTCAGLPKDFRPLHGLRHVFASMLASSGQVDMYTLQKLLTHKSPQMVMRYAHLRDETLKRASNLMGELVEQAVNGGKSRKVVNLHEMER